MNPQSPNHSKAGGKSPSSGGHKSCGESTPAAADIDIFIWTSTNPSQDHHGPPRLPDPRFLLRPRRQVRPIPIVPPFVSPNLPPPSLYAEPASIAWLRSHYASRIKAEDVVIVSPDAGGVKRATSIAYRLGTDFAMIHKERTEASMVSKMVLVGKVTGKMAVLIDDMCDTAGTLCKAADTVKAHGAAEVLAICTHGILSGNAIENLNRCEGLSKLVVTNTVPLQGKEGQCAKIETINIAPTLSEAIRRTHNVSYWLS